MSNLGRGGPPDRVPTTPTVDLSYEELQAAGMQEIGRGGDGVVYRVEVERPQRQFSVAIKLPATEGQTVSTELANQIAEEAEIWQGLTNSDKNLNSEEQKTQPQEHIVDVLDWGKSPFPWIAMEYMDAGDLSELQDRERLPVDQALWVGLCVCRAVWHAHRHGVVHNDLKPSNILLRESSTGWLIPKVSDWGVATVMLGSGGDERKGLTPEYAAPEQLDTSDHRPINEKTDIYQVGLILYELLTGQLPFEGSLPELKEQKGSEQPKPPSEVADVPTEVDQVVLEALSNSPAARYDTIVYLRDELEGLFEIYGSTGKSRASDPVETAVRTDAHKKEHSHKPADSGTDSSVSQPTTATAEDEPADQSDTDEVNDQEAQRSSWDEYKHELDRKQRNFGYSILPNPLRRLVYRDLVTEVEEAEARRESVSEDFETAKSTAVELQSLEERIHGARRRGEPLPDDIDVSGRVEEIKTVRARLKSLLVHQSQYLRSDEQSRIDELRTQLKQLREYLKAKQKLEREIDEVGSAIDDVEESIEESITPDELLASDEEASLISKLDDISRWLRTARAELRTDTLAEEDLERFDALLNQERSLRDRVKEHNPDLVQSRYKNHIEEIEELHATVHEEVEPIRTDGGKLSDNPDQYIQSIEEGLDGINRFLDTRQNEYLSESQQEELDAIRADLRADLTFIETKSEFDDRIQDIQVAVAEFESEAQQTLDLDTYLTTPERESLETQIDDLNDRILSVRKDLSVDDLADTDQQRLERLQTAVGATQAAVNHHNGQLLQRHRERFDTTFSNLTEEDISLNQNQQTAIIRNDIHNQVVAGPGTGKTFSLACRIKYLLEIGVPADDILALAFSRNAKNQMQRRLRKLFGITGVEVTTLHSFGMNIINDVYPKHIALVEESRLREIGRALQHLENSDSEAATHLEKFRTLHAEKNLEQDRKKRKDLYESLQYNSAKTFRGEQLESSFDEIQSVHARIANILFKHGVSYEYKQYAPWADPADDEAYIPDFTLPEFDVYIEYFPSQGIRQQQNPWDRKRTQDEIQSFYSGTDKRLIDIPSGIAPDDVETIITNILSDLGISDQLSKNELIDAAYEYNILQRDVEELFAEFVKKAKTNQVNPKDELPGLDQEEDPILYHFTYAAAAVLRIYSRLFEDYDAFDYVDMILQARNALENGSAQEQIDYRHLLVDEFQDLNLAQIDLLRQLLSQQADSRLFAVGDDWQSIYGFKGARPDYFVNFDEQFAPSSRTDLETNYRCPPAVVEASSDLIKQNEVRISKSLYAASDIEMTPTVHSVPGTDDYQYERNAIIHAVKLIKNSLNTAGRSPSDILVLARNRKGSPFIRRISNRLKRDDIPVANSEGAGGVRVTTAHDAKGSEADHVLIVNAAEDREDGFPAMETERSLTQAVEIATESHIPEERRLFYVALTRAKEQLDIQTRTNAHSRFLREIQEHTQQRNILVNCQRDRISIELGVTDVLNSNSGWETRQLGTLERGDYQLKFAIPDTADDISLLKEGETYRFENIQIGEYNGQPQFRIDEETTVIEPEPAND